MPVDYGFLRQRYLDDINRLRFSNEDNSLKGNDRTLERHVQLLKEAVVSIKNGNYKNEEENNLRKWISDTFKELLKDLKQEFIHKNNKLINAIWEEHQIAIWSNKHHPTVLFMRVEGINVAF